MALWPDLRLNISRTDIKIFYLYQLFIFIKSIINKEKLLVILKYIFIK